MKEPSVLFLSTLVLVYQVSGAQFSSDGMQGFDLTEEGANKSIKELLGSDNTLKSNKRAAGSWMYRVGLGKRVGLEGSKEKWLNSLENRFDLMRRNFDREAALNLFRNFIHKNFGEGVNRGNSWQYGLGKPGTDIKEDEKRLDRWIYRVGLGKREDGVAPLIDDQSRKLDSVEDGVEKRDALSWTHQVRRGKLANENEIKRAITSWMYKVGLGKRGGNDDYKRANGWMYRVGLGKRDENGIERATKDWIYHVGLGKRDQDSTKRAASWMYRVGLGKRGNGEKRNGNWMYRVGLGKRSDVEASREVDNSH